MKWLSLISITCTLVSCSTDPNIHFIDLSEAVVEKPEDGVGHYVYALSLPYRVSPGEDLSIQMEWRTVGGVDPNARYTMDLILQGPSTKTYEVPSGANTVGELHLANWLSYDFEVPQDFPTGEYTIGVRLRDASRDLATVPLGFRAERAMDDGFYRVATVEITTDQAST